MSKCPGHSLNHIESNQYVRICGSRSMLSRLFCCDVSNGADEFAEYCKRGPKRPLALGDETPRKKRCAVDQRSPRKSACAVDAFPGNVIRLSSRKKRCALDVCSGQDKFKAAMGPKSLSDLFGCEESVHVDVCRVGERCIKKRRVGEKREHPKAKTCKTTAAEKRSNADVFVGSVHETAAGHWQRHRESPKEA